MNIITCRCSIKGEVTFSSFASILPLCLGLSVPFMGGIYAKLKKGRILVIFCMVIGYEHHYLPV